MQSNIELQKKEKNMLVLKKYAPLVLSLFIAFVFIQSLFFKFTGSVETQYIFSVLDNWAASFGFGGLFVPPGIFNAYVIGSAELVASLLLLGGLVFKKPLVNLLGAMATMGVISGAIFFHLFTPLGIVVLDDGGTLFAMACGVWVSAAIIIFLRRAQVKQLCAMICYCPFTKAK
jgi:uncharacterized membrane protein YphA (DoxX/SURF4 family)